MLERGSTYLWIQILEHFQLFQTKKINALEFCNLQSYFIYA